MYLNFRIVLGFLEGTPGLNLLSTVVFVLPKILVWLSIDILMVKMITFMIMVVMMMHVCRSKSVDKADNRPLHKFD